jgi:hypothetical protein
MSTNHLWNAKPKDQLKMRSKEKYIFEIAERVFFFHFDSSYFQIS